MNQTRAACGCCEGIERLTPIAIDNRPGLDAMIYRIGTHGSFLQTMLAELPGREALGGLSTRETGDPAIAMLDAWAVVADVLTFYQERIANEGYLRTALERRSVLELARLVGYALRPGVASSVYLAYTLEDGHDALIQYGNRAQSVPGPGETAQTFETAEPLEAHAALNILRPRLSRPQYLTLKTILPDSGVVEASSGVPAPTKLYLKGTSTNLKANDALLLHFGSTAPKLFQVVNIELPPGFSAVNLDNSGPTGSVANGGFAGANLRPGPAPNYTAVTLRPADSNQATDDALKIARLAAAAAALPHIAAVAQQAVNNSRNAVGRFSLVNSPTSKVRRVLDNLNQTLTQTTDDFSVVSALNNALLPNLEREHDEARARNAPNLADWLRELADSLKGVATLGASSLEEIALEPQPDVVSILSSLKTPSSLSRQPANTLQLDRGVGSLYKTGTDLVPRLFTALHPEVAATAYAALANATVETNNKTASEGLNRVEVLRVKASLFGHNAPPVARFGRREGRIVEYIDPLSDTTLFSSQATVFAPGEAINNGEHQRVPDEMLDLDAQYDQIKPGSWVALENPDLTPDISYYQIEEVQTISRTDFGISSKITRLTLNDRWPDVERPLSGIIRHTTVYAQAEELERAEELVHGDIGNVKQDDANSTGGDSLELDALYQGLESGRWVIVQGERTDLQIGGVVTAELAMLAEVVHRAATIPGTEQLLPGDTLHTFMRFAAPLAYSYKRETVLIYGNVLRATHGETRHEVLGSGDGSKALQEFTLKQPPLTYISAPTPAGAASTLEVRVNDVLWHEADNLIGLSSNDRCYTTRTDDDDKTTVVFGTGEHGARLPTGLENVKAVYRNGIGRPGNAKAGQISLLLTQPPGVKNVINPLAASGGADRESGDQARRNAPLGVTALGRLVSVRDYADFARTFAGIGKASTARLSDGRRHLVHLTIAGANDVHIDADSDLYRNLQEALQLSGDPFQPVRVDVRELLVLIISANVRVQADYAWALVEPKIRTALLQSFSFERRDLGQDAVSAEAINVIQKTPGVDYVDLDIFDIIDEAKLRGLKEGSSLSVQLGLQPRIVVHKARPDRKEKGKTLPAQIAFLTPDVRETLLLKEIK